MYSRDAGLVIKVHGHWPLWGFHRTAVKNMFLCFHLHLAGTLLLILSLDWSYKSQSLTKNIVHKPTACKYPKFVFVLSGGIHNAISFQSRQGKCRCDFFTLCCLQNGSHPVHCSFFACLSEACRWIFSFENVGSLWIRCTHILSLFPEASDSNLSGIVGCLVMSFVVLQANIVLVSDWKRRSSGRAV